MKYETEDEEKYQGRRITNVHYRLLNCSSFAPNVNEDVIDFYNVNNTISRVDYTQEFYDDDTKPSLLLNLDNQNKRKVSDFDFDYGEEPACKKLFSYNEDEEETDLQGWRTKQTEEWSKTETKSWLIWAGIKLGHSYRLMPRALALPGKELLLLSRENFIYYDRYFGDKLYDLLQEGRDTKKFLPPFDTLQKSISDDETSLGSVNNYSDEESVPFPDSVKKRSPGRPRTLDPKRKVAKVKLWEFIRNLLLNPKYCPRWICWDDYDKKRFRFVQSDKVAKLWGERKNNKNMTYEKFSRAMRYYYPKLIFVAVPGRRLVYEFGAKATGLETDNPNFDPNYYSERAVRSNI